MKKITAAVCAALIISVLGGCEFFMGPDEPAGNGGGNLSVSVGTGDSRAITSGKDLPEEVRAALRYDITLTGPGGETIERTLADGENLQLTAALGEWRIDAAARQEGLGIIVGTGSLAFTVLPGINAVRVPMTMESYYYSITLPDGPNGIVDASPRAAFPGTLVTLTVTPGDGYILNALTYSYTGGEGVPEGNGSTYTFTMPAADVTVHAEFEPPASETYTITAAAMSHGAVSANPASAPAGTIVTLTVTPETGYELKSGTLAYRYTGGEGVPAESGAAYTFTMPAADVTVHAEFERVTHTITTTGLINGAVSANPASAPAGTTVTLTVTPGEDYELTSGTLKYRYADEEGTPSGSGTTYTFTMPAADVTIHAEFERITHTITTTGLIDGAVSANPASATAGTLVTLTVTPGEDHVLTSGTLKYQYTGGEGTPSGSGPAYTFTMPAADVTVHAEFERITHTITTTGLINGAVSANPASAPAGTTVTLTVTPHTNYVLKSGSLIYRTDGDGTPIRISQGGGTTYTFEMPPADITVYAEFNWDQGFTIEGPGNLMVPVTRVHSAGQEPPTTISWTGNESITFTVEGPYTVGDNNLKWLVNGENPVETPNGNSLTISAEHYIRRTYTLTVMIKADDNQWYSSEDYAFTVIQ
jgi:hypothetical protein